MIDKRLFKECKRSKLYIPLSIIFSVLNAVFIVVGAYLLSKIIDAIFIKKYNLQMVGPYIVGFALNALIKSVVGFLIEAKLRNISEDIKENIRNHIFQKVLLSNPIKIAKERYGELITTLTDGVEAIVPYYSQYIPQLISSLVIPLIIAISAFSFDSLSAIIMLITYPIIPIFMMLIGYRSKKVSEKQWKRLSTLSSHFLEMLQGLSTLKVFGRSKLQEEKVYKISEDYRKTTMDVLKITFLSAFVLELSATISTAVIAVDLGLRLVYSKITFSSAFFILVLAPDFYLPLRQLGLKFHASLNGQVAIEKIEELENTLSENNKAIDSATIEDEVGIEVKKLSYSHQSREAINNVSFKINKGERIALIGESGSGKSTLVNILCKLLPVERGAVYINGRDINDISREEYLKKVAVVPQFPHIFDMSIEDNITLGHGKSTHNLLETLKAAKVDSFANEYSSNLETIIGEGEDIAVSGGEKQRIAIARALYKSANFVLLDEPTSAMDSETEELLNEVMENSFKDKTVLLSAHRLSTVKNADKLLVMKDGRLIEYGSPQELILSKGYYYNLIKTSEHI